MHPQFPEDQAQGAWDRLKHGFLSIKGNFIGHEYIILDFRLGFSCSSFSSLADIHMHGAMTNFFTSTG
jgi:hypothetical protein